MEIIFILFVVIFYVALFLFALIASLVSSAICGAAVGAIPLMCGIVRKKPGLGWIGFAVCFVLYLTSGFLLAQIASALFTFFIVKKNRKKIEE